MSSRLGLLSFALALVTGCAVDAEPTPATATLALGGPGIGESCGPENTCADGLLCETYYGIAGKSGPQIQTCELPCDVDDDCPAGRRCITQSDGAAQVCR